MLVYPLPEALADGTIDRKDGRVRVWVRGRWVRLRWWAHGRRLTYRDLTEPEREARAYYLHDNYKRRRYRRGGDLSDAG